MIGEAPRHCKADVLEMFHVWAERLETVDLARLGCVLLVDPQRGVMLESKPLFIFVR